MQLSGFLGLDLIKTSRIIIDTNTQRLQQGIEQTRNAYFLVLDTVVFLPCYVLVLVCLCLFSYFRDTQAEAVRDLQLVLGRELL